MIILLFAFGTVTAMAMPILSAVLGLACALSIIRLLENVIEVPSTASTLATMIGLGVGIDYALFIVTRHKLQLRDGMEVMESVARATATAGGAVVFAGFTVIIALCSLFVAGIPLVTALGLTAAVAVVVAVLAAATLLPAMLGALGPHINSLRVQLGEDASRRQAAPRLGALGPTGRRQAPAGGDRRGADPGRPRAADPRPRIGPAGQQRAAEIHHRSPELRRPQPRASGPGYNGPLLVAVEFGTPAKPDQKNIDKVNSSQKQLDAQKQQIAAEEEAAGVPPDQAQQDADQKTAAQQQKLDQQRKQAEDPATDPQLTTLQKDISKAPDVKAVSAASLDKKGTAAVFSVVSDSSPSADATVDLVNNLRDSVIPKALKGTDLTAYVGGQTAGYIDLANEISDQLPLMILIVVGLSFIVLFLAFRSILVPLKAAFMNLLSVAAAYGVVTAVFQKGWGASLIGLDHSIPIVSYVPLLMFAILFGLSMDYEVFLMTQIREHFSEHGRRQAGGDRGTRQHRPGDHLGGADHGLRVLELRAQRQPGGQGVRGRPRGGDRDRRDHRPLPAGAGADGPDERARLVAAPGGWIASSPT